MSLFTLVFFSHFIIPIFPVIVAIFIIYVTRTQRLLLKTKQTPIYNLNTGLVKIQGTVEALKILETPFFKAQCICYSYENASVSYTEDGSDHVTNATQSNDFQDFYLVNETGRIKVIADHLNLSFLPAQVKTIHSIKQNESDIRHTERTLKNGDLINVMGNAVKNEQQHFELRAEPKSPLVISTSAIENRTEKGFRAMRYLTPYILLMYISVNYFLFFAPVKLHLEKNTAFILFSFFGMPILAVILGLAGNRMYGFLKVFFSNLAGICFSVSILSFPLLCLLFATETEFYRIICIWLSVFSCTTLAFVINYRKLDEIFNTD
ncbi:hypothetical protein [Pedobacter sp. KBW06]|uniref:hypothetical protein n=1 Tax=Pedobacter sp. KBW06 TaxID=2153359 RepID=UPI000F5AE7E7|nr:hypothetical protein [Pedobacter sp. KBW06]